MDEIAVLIPCYNEAATIAKVVGDFAKALPGAAIYVYDNNSTDDTAFLARQAGAIVRRERQQGKGNVIRRMFYEVDAACCILVDGDDTYPAEAAAQMADMVLREGADMVVGDRLSTTYDAQNDRPMHGFGNKLVRGLINALFKSDLKDIMTGYRAFSYRFVKSFPVLSQAFEIETEMSIHAIDKNLAVRSVPVAYRNRPSGSVSKLNTWRDGMRVLATLGRLFRNYRPMAFFGAIGGCLMALALGFFIPVLMEYLRTGLVRRFPTLIACGFAAIAALQSLFAGLILKVLYQKNRQDFEQTLYQLSQSDPLKPERRP